MITEFNLGFVPPQACELEEAVLGAVLQYPSAINDCADIITENSFYKETHKLIWLAIKQLYVELEPIDIITTAEMLKKQNTLEMVGGAYYLTQITNKVISPSNVEYNARIIKEKEIARQLILGFSDLVRRSYDNSEDIFDLISDAETTLSGINDNLSINKTCDISNIAVDAISEMKTKVEKYREGKLNGVPSGFTDLDRITGGWQNSNLIILAARPSMGKTSVALEFAKRAAELGMPSAFYSMEMASIELFNKYNRGISSLYSEKLKTGNLTDQELTSYIEASRKLSKLPMYIDDKPSLTIQYLRLSLKKLKREKSIKIAFVDYMQLADVSGSKKNANREQDISFISRSLKSLAKELNIPIVALSQLSRSVEETKDKRPQLRHLRESGAIEQDADMVIFIYRPDYYGIVDSSGESTKGLIELIIAKHRDGSLGNPMIRHNEDFTRFYDIDQNISYDEPEACTEF